MLSLLRPCTYSTWQTVTRAAYTTYSQSTSIPWFVDGEPEATPSSLLRQPIHAPKPLPPDAPAHLAKLQDVLCKSPLLEPGGVEVREFTPPPPGPILPHQIPKGRRMRGRTDFGFGIPDPAGGLWRWIVLAQVKEGTERRGALQSVLRLVRKELVAVEPPLPLPPNRKLRLQDGDGWRMLDAGEFSVHIVSKAARQKYFSVDQGRQAWL